MGNDENDCPEWWPADGRLGRHHSHPPSDRRRIDPEAASRLRNLVANTGWSGEGADFAILRLVYAARIERGTISVPSWAYSQDVDRLGDPVGPARYYVTTAGISRPRYTESLDAALGLLRSVFPQHGYGLTQVNGSEPEAHLILGGVAQRPWRSRSAPLALLAAILDELSRNPEAAAARRMP